MFEELFACLLVSDEGCGLPPRARNIGRDEASDAADAAAEACAAAEADRDAVGRRLAEAEQASSRLAGKADELAAALAGRDGELERVAERLRQCQVPSLLRGVCALTVLAVLAVLLVTAKKPVLKPIIRCIKAHV